MNLRVINWGLAAALVLAVGLNFVFHGDRTQPNFEYFPDMAHSPRANAFAPNAAFADGKTLQSPPAGAIARGFLPLHYTASAEDARRAGTELVNPVAATDANARGAFVFSTYCQPCHGAGGRGDGPVAQRGFPPPPSLVTGKSTEMRDGQLFHILTYGQGNMPSYASQIAREDRWKAVSYIRWLQAQGVASAAKP